MDREWINSKDQGINTGENRERIMDWKDLPERRIVQ